MLRSTSRKLSATALIGALAVTAGCGSDIAVRGGEPFPMPADLACFDGNIAGAGSSAQENAMRTWIAAYQTNCEDAQIFYDAIGSGGGRNQFIDGAVDFAGSDAAISPAELKDAAPRCLGSDAINIPAYVVPVAVVFNLKGVDSLNLTPQVIARIFDGKITRWDDQAIADANPGVNLPDTRITPVSRSDESGTTENFTQYLHAAAGDDWPYEPSGQWPVPPAEAAQGNSGIADTVQGGEGTIGYVEASHVGHMSAAKVGVGDEFVELSPESAARVVAESPQREGGNALDRAIDIDYGTTASGAYPIVLVSYEIACLKYDSAEDAARLRDFLSYVISPEGQESASKETGSAPLPEDIRSDLQESIDAISGS
ncbi:phosphate ABC transporter substrate-binding protein PstS [Nocardiopsis gilva]|nr:phosphate ABC transporter substrate-binding protein PstS [Nocardiopsis gilva]